MSLESTEFRDFRGGLNFRDSKASLLGNELQDARDMRLTDGGGLITREAEQTFTNLPTAKIGGFMKPWYLTSGRVVLIVSASGNLYKYDTTTLDNPLTLLYTGTLNSEWHWEASFVTSSGTQGVWLVNGLDPPQFLQSSTLTVIGGPAGLGDYTVVKSWKNRMVAAGSASLPFRVQFSNLGNPDVYNTGVNGDFVDLKTSEDDVEPITWMEVLGDMLLVFKKHSVWRITGEVPNISVTRLGTPGCYSRYQADVLDGRVYFWAGVDLWSTDGITAPIVESSLMTAFIRANVPFSSNYLNRVRVMATRGRRILVSVATSGGQVLMEFMPWLRTTRPDGADQGAWMLHRTDVGAMCNFRVNQLDKIVGCNYTDQRVFELFVPGTAIASPMPYVQTPWEELVPGETYERLRRVNVVCDGGFDIDTLGDFSTTPKYTASVGNAFDGNPGVQRVRPESRARHHSLKFSGPGPWSVDQYQLVFRGGKEH